MNMNINYNGINDFEKILYTKEQLQNRIKELGQQITSDYKDEELVVICVLKGASLFMTDLIKNIDLPMVTDFIAVSSYGSNQATSGIVQLIKDTNYSVKDRHVLLVEDIIDTGLTLKYLKEMFSLRYPKTLRIASLLDKPSRRKANIKGDYIGFEVEDVFVVGYGLDYDERYRNTECIGILKPEIYQK